MVNFGTLVDWSNSEDLAEFSWGRCNGVEYSTINITGYISLTNTKS